ncbi:MAG: PAS domain-containing protein [Chloroflexi bacterium]|nr:PAS domain-containing protein [Chloroflexota bacterium]
MKNWLTGLPGAFPDAVLVVDAQGRIIHANAQAAYLFGLDEQAMNGMHIQALFPDQLLAFPGGRSGPGDQAGRYLELVGSRGDSSRFPAVVAIMPVTIEHVSAMIISIRDLTEAQRAQFVLRRGVEVVMSENRDRQALLRHLIRVREEERVRIAADIHDDAIQLISAASLRLQQLRLRLRDQAARRILDKLQEALTLSSSHLRQLIFDLRPAALQAGSLGPALQVYLEQMHADTGIAYRLDDRLSSRAPDGTALLIYRNVLEVLANVRKHSGASTVAVELLDVEEGYLVRIVDDGVGYDPADIEDRPGHLGLVLIRERAELAGGWCRIESSPGTGTTVEFWVPAGQSTTAPEAGHEHAG